MTLADLKIGQDAVLRTIGGQGELRHHLLDIERKSTRLNSSHSAKSRMPSSA